jgi:tetratricopeptide (TPR) repeat protein
MSNYLGNDTLSPAVKDRVLSTFQQTLALYKQGRMDEVVAGCGLILRMDPAFDPAKKLIDKVRNPNLPIDVDSLGPAAPPRGDLMTEARQAMASRDFQRAVNLTTEILTDDLMNDDARILNEQAREKIEAGPFVDQFARKCEQHITNKNFTAARSDLEKARALDPDHPALRRVELLLSAAGGNAPAPPAASFSFDAASSAGPSPSFVVDAPAPASGRGTAHAADFGFTFEEEKQQAPAPAAPSSGGGFSFDAPSPAPPPPANDAPFGGFSFDAPTPATPTGDALSNFSFEAPKPAPPPPAAPPAAPSGGFSFDAPASGGFSFDSPSSFGSPSSASAEGPRTFDFSTSPSEVSPDDQRKIQQYLADGDRAFDGADYQQAIDLWSRIFLIDVTNEQASERIERAKLKRRDVDSKVDAIVAAGVTAFERNDNDTARAKFQEALRMDPRNSAAQDYLERINETGTEGGAAGYELPFEPPPPRADLFADEDDNYGDSTLMPPEPDAIPAPAAKGKAAAPAKAKAAPVASGAKKSPMTLIAVVVAVLVLAGGGWFAYTKFVTKAAPDTVSAQEIFRKVQSLAAAGKYDQAIAMLQDVKGDDPLHDRAIQMMAELKQKQQTASEMVDGKPAAVVYQESLAAGKAAFDSHDYDGAKKAWDIAARIKPLLPETQALYQTAAQQVAKLDAAKALFKETHYQDAIASLEPLLLQDPQNQNIRRMINDAHFNLGAAALQEERLADALTQFDDVLKGNPNDEMAKRSRDLAARYNNQPKDLLYKIYVKYLPLRNPT